MNKEEKEKHLSEYWSHEFNFFLKKRDKDFFENTVRRILSSKMEKTIVDYWLLDMYDKVLESEEFILVSQNLNAFEMSLYIDSLMKQGKKTDDQNMIK